MRDRAERLVELLPAEGVDLLLVTSLVNVRYMTGYTGSNGLALIGPDRRVFVTDFRYVEQAAAEVDPSFERRRDQQELFDVLEGLLPEGEIRLGFEDSNVTVRQHSRLRELLPERVGAGRRGRARRAPARRQGRRRDRADSRGGRRCRRSPRADPRPGACRPDRA